MTITQTPRQRPPTPAEINARHKADAERELARRTGASPRPPVSEGTAVATKPATTVAVPDSRTPVQQYVDAIAPSAIAGRLVKFSKDGQFVIAETGEAIDPDKDFVAMCDEVLIGWIRFNGPDTPPDRHQGLLYDNFVMPARESLGDLDPAKWEMGLSGQPADPWQHQICLVLQARDTLELFTFVTTSITGRRGVGSLLRHFDRMRRADPDHYPVVRLKVGGFQHKDPRVGFVATPQFAIVGKAPKASAAIPDTSVATDLNDALPF